MLIHRVGLEVVRVTGSLEEDSRYALNAVNVDDTGRLSATDGKMVLRIEAACTEPDLFMAEELPEMRVLQSESVLLPADIVRDFSRACKRKKKGHDQVVVSVEGGQPTLATADGKTRRRFEAKPSDLKFPAIERVIPEKSKVSVVLDVELLATMLRTLKAMGCKSVKLGITDAESALRIDAKIIPVGATETLKIDGALMPMREA